MSIVSLAARFKVKVRCYNCRKDTVHKIDVPEAEDAPTCVDELADSQFLADQRFLCQPCDLTIGIVVAITQMELVHA